MILCLISISLELSYLILILYYKANLDFESKEYEDLYSFVSISLYQSYECSYSLFTLYPLHFICCFIDKPLAKFYRVLAASIRTLIPIFLFTLGRLSTITIMIYYPI